MLNYYLIFFLVIVAVSGEEYELSDSFDPSLDVLIPRKNLENARRAQTFNRNQKVNDNQDMSCVKRSQKDEDPSAINWIDEPPPTDQELPPFPLLDQNYEQTSPDSLKLEQSVSDIQDVGYPENLNLDHSTSKDHEHEEPSALELRSSPPDNEPSRRFDNIPIDPSNLAAELQDCLEKKLHQKTNNVVVVMPVLDNKQPSEDVNDEKYLLTFVQPQGNVHIREIEDDSLVPSKQESKCNKKHIKDEKDSNVETDNVETLNEIKKDSNLIKDPLIKSNIHIKQENKVQKFLRTGIAEDTIKNDQNIEHIDGRRRNNFYERLPLTEVVDQDGQKTTGDERSVAGEPVSSERRSETGSENSRAGVTDRRVCYACSTLNNPSCQSPNRMTTVKYCAGSRNSCVKKTYETGGTSVLIRDCAATCNDNVLPVGIVPKYKTCDLCHTDLCNGAYSIKDQGLLIFFFLTSWALCKILV